MLILNGIKIPGHSMTVRANFRIASRELSGQTSASDRASEGIKPMTFAVSLQIPFTRDDDLTRLVAMAIATDDNGDMVVYQISNSTAAACKVRLVTFSDQFTVTEQNQINCWNIGFTLVEYQSIAEKVEQRQPQPVAVEQDDGTTTETTAPDADNETDEEQLTGFLKILKRVDEALA